jgi:hypothetical protein
VQNSQEVQKFRDDTYTALKDIFDVPFYVSFYFDLFRGVSLAYALPKAPLSLNEVEETHVSFDSKEHRGYDFMAKVGIVGIPPIRKFLEIWKKRSLQYDKYGNLLNFSVYA